MNLLCVITKTEKERERECERPVFVKNGTGPKVIEHRQLPNEKKRERVNPLSAGENTSF